jgi:hypothetical protein
LAAAAGVYFATRPAKPKLTDHPHDPRRGFSTTRPTTRLSTIRSGRV